MALQIPLSENYPYLLWRALSNPRKAARALMPVRKMPSYVWIEITNRCNIRCRTCSKFYQKGDPGDDIELGLFDSIFSQVAPSLECINLTGIGEPLFHPEAARIFDRLQEHPNLRVELTTNAQLMDEQWIRRLSAMKCNVTFSIDGSTEETYRFNRPAGNIGKVRDALQMAREAELASPDPAQFAFRRRINFVVMRQNMHQIPEIVEWTADYGCEMLVLILMNNWGCPEEFWREQNPLNYRSELIPILAETKALAASKGLKLVAPSVSETAEETQRGAPLQPGLLRFFKPSDATAQGYPRFQDRSCSVPFTSMYFQANGLAGVCCAAWGMVLGDARKQTVEQIWNGLPFRILRAQTLTGAHCSYCRACDLPYGLAKGNPRDKLVS